MTAGKLGFTRGEGGVAAAAAAVAAAAAAAAAVAAAATAVAAVAVVVVANPGAEEQGRDVIGGIGREAAMAACLLGIGLSLPARHRVARWDGGQG